MKLGKLRKVEVRDIWTSEANDFTPWLANEENLESLGEAIGIELEHEATEKNVGPFRADILCKDTSNGNWVLVENQLGKTDHTHLGQLLTYAAGLNAVTIIWIAQPFTEEHRAALDWLNEITDKSFNFFGLEIELWRIGDSDPAPKFNVISKPNDWTNSVSSAARSIEEGELTDTKKLQHEYWVQFASYLEEENSDVRPAKPGPHHWRYYSVGRAGFNLGTTLNSRDNVIGVELYIKHENALSAFQQLIQQKDSIEKDVDFELEWEELPDRKGSRIGIKKENSDPLDKKQWAEQMEWMKDMLERFNAAFRKRVKQLDLENWSAPEAAE